MKKLIVNSQTADITISYLNNYLSVLKDSTELHFVHFNRDRVSFLIGLLKTGEIKQPCHAEQIAMYLEFRKHQILEKTENFGHSQAQQWQELSMLFDYFNTGF